MEGNPLIVFVLVAVLNTLFLVKNVYYLLLLWVQKPSVVGRQRLRKLTLNSDIRIVWTRKSYQICSTHVVKFHACWNKHVFCKKYLGIFINFNCTSYRCHHLAYNSSFLFVYGCFILKILKSKIILSYTVYIYIYMDTCIYER